MSRFYLSLIVILLPILLAAANEPLHTSSTINSVTVFLKGAEIRAATKPFTLKAGTQAIIIEDLPTDINDKTIQVSGTGDFTILAVQFKLNHIKTKIQEADVKHLQDTLKLINAQILHEQDAKATLEGMVQMLDANKAVAGANAGLNTDILVKALDIYYSKMTKLREELAAINELMAKLRDTYNRVHTQLLPYQLENPTGEVTVTVSTKAPLAATLKINYLVNNAGWAPEYDVRCRNTTQPVTLLYKARVYQNSGSLWDNVRLTISTGNPSRSATSPFLDPVYADFPSYNDFRTYSWTTSKNSLSNSAMADSVSVPEKRLETDGDGVIDKFDLEANTPAKHTAIVKSPVSVEFSIDLPYTIPSDDQEHIVTIQENSLKTDYHYYAAPKAEANAFLVGSVTDWAALNLLPGKTNIFYEGTYVGQSDIDPNNTSDTLNLSLGIDKSIIVKRIELKKQTSTGFSGDKVRKKYAFEITLKNTKQTPVDFKLVDQIPVSRNKDIVITDIETTGGKLNEVTGKIHWDLQLAAGEEKKIILSYTAKYPKDKVVTGLE